MRHLIFTFFLLSATAASAQLSLKCEGGKFEITGDSVSGCSYQWIITRTGTATNGGWQVPYQVTYTKSPNLALDSCGTYLHVRRNARKHATGQAISTDVVEWKSTAFETPTLTVTVSPNPCPSGQQVKVQVGGNWFKRYRVTLARVAGNGFVSGSWKYSPGTVTYPTGFLLPGQWVATVHFETACGEKVSISKPFNLI